MQLNLVGPFSRKEAAQVSETSVIATVFKGYPSGTMIDVGAHRGSACGPFLAAGWTVHAFEPDPENRGELEKNFVRNGRLHIVKDAVSDRTQSDIPFYKSGISTGISGLSAFHESHAQKGSVSTITLTEYLSATEVRQVDFLKIDTEGFDLMVLRGFPWERCKPQIIECEYEDSKTVPLGYDFHDLASFLVEHGYSVLVSEWHPVVQYGMQHDWHRLAKYPSELANAKGWGNLVAFQNTGDGERFISELSKRIDTKPKRVDPEDPVQANMVDGHRAAFVDKLKGYATLFYNFYKTVPGVISIVCIGLSIMAESLGDALFGGNIPSIKAILAMSFQAFLLLFLVAYLVTRVRHEVAQLEQSKQERQEMRLELSRMAKRMLELRRILIDSQAVISHKEKTSE